MTKQSTDQNKILLFVLREYVHGKARSGNTSKVKNRKQATHISINDADLPYRKKYLKEKAD